MTCPEDKLEKIIFNKHGVIVREQPNLRRICLEFGENLNYEMVKTLIIQGLMMGVSLAQKQMGVEEDKT